MGYRMRISLICVGKLKERYLTAAVEEYIKRLGPYCKTDIIELPDEKTPDNAGPAQAEAIKIREGERILRAIKPGSYSIALAIEGSMLSSPEFAEKVGMLGVNGISHINFIIGGSLGLSKEVLNRADYKLSFSQMTFPHQLIRVFLLEQIYRAFRILNNQPYHK